MRVPEMLMNGCCLLIKWTILVAVEPEGPGWNYTLAPEMPILGASSCLFLLTRAFLQQRSRSRRCWETFTFYMGPQTRAGCGLLALIGIKHMTRINPESAQCAPVC